MDFHWNFVTAVALKKLESCPYQRMERVRLDRADCDGRTDLPQQYRAVHALAC